MRLRQRDTYKLPAMSRWRLLSVMAIPLIASLTLLVMALVFSPLPRAAVIAGVMIGIPTGMAVCLLTIVWQVTDKKR